LGNKTPEIFKSWIRAGNALLVAIEDERILAVGCVTDVGEITLNYVSPDARFRGVSGVLLAVLEDRARERGNERCTLKSTETARRFYRKEAVPNRGPLTANSARPPATRCRSTWSPGDPELPVFSAGVDPGAWAYRALLKTSPGFLDISFRNALGPRPRLDGRLAVFGDGLPDHPAGDGVGGN
jgi:hypothetical protein